MFHQAAHLAQAHFQQRAAHIVEHLIVIRVELLAALEQAVGLFHQLQRQAAEHKVERLGHILGQRFLDHIEDGLELRMLEIARRKARQAILLQLAVQAVDHIRAAHQHPQAVAFQGLARRGRRGSGQRLGRGGGQAASLARAGSAARARLARVEQGALIHLQQARQALAVGIPLHRVGHLADQRQHLGGNGALDLGVVHILPGGQRLHHVDDHRAGVLDDALPLGRVALDHVVGVHVARQGGDADIGLQARFVPQQAAGVENRLLLAIHGLAGNLQAAQGGLIAGRVGVEGQDDAAGEALEQAQLVLGEGGAHRRDGVGKAGLVQGDHVQVALDDDRLVEGADGLARPVEAVQQVAFVKQGRLRRVEELGNVIWVQDARPKADHAAALIADGDGDAVAEAVVDAAGGGLGGLGLGLLGLARPLGRLAHRDQPGVNQVLLAVALGFEVFERRIPGIGGIAQPKGFQRGILQAALAQVGQGLLPGGGAGELVTVKSDRFFQQGTQVLVLFGGFLLLGRGRLELHAGFFGQGVQGLAEIPALFLHYITEDIAALVALPKAAPGARFGEDHEGRRARVGVEGAKAGVVLARTPQRDRL